MTPVLMRTLAQERGRILGWLAGIGLLALITLGSWPAVRDSAGDFEQALAELPEAFTAFFGEGLADFSAAGIIGSRLFGTIGLAVFIGYAVSRGARGVAGEEQDGTLELLLAQPIARTAIAVDKIVAMLLGLAGLIAVQLLIILFAMPVIDVDFAIGNVIGASIGLFCLAALFGGIAFGVGAATGARGLAVGVGAGTAGALFVGGGLAGLVDGLAWLADLSPFTHFDGSLVLARGLSATPAVVNATLAVLAIAAGVVAFDRRDVT